MSRVIDVDYNQALLFPPSLEDYLPADHPARFIRDWVDSLDLGALGFQVSAGGVGAPHYATSLLLKAWLYGYLKKIHSTRKLEEGCREQIGLMWLTGMLMPDHNTLWRFWQKNRDVLKNLFKQTVKVASQAGMIGLLVHALDGTKFLAQVSKDKAWNQGILEKDMGLLEEAIEAMMKDLEATEKHQTGEFRLPEALQDARKRKEVLQEALAVLEQQERKNLHPADPDARMMKTRTGLQLAYNAQVVSDAKSGLIIAEDVVTDENDQGQLTPMLDKVKENLGQVAQENLGDAGYHTEEQLHQAEEKDYPVLLNESRGTAKKARKNPFHKSHFQYDSSIDSFQCPHQAVTLPFERIKKNKQGQEIRLYRCGNKGCPQRTKCSKDPRGKTIEKSAYYQAAQRQREKQQQAENQVKLQQRGQTVEIIFAWIKEHLGFRRSVFRSLKKVKAQWSLICTTLNLKIMYKYWQKGELQLKPR